MLRFLAGLGTFFCVVIVGALWLNKVVVGHAEFWSVETGAFSLIVLGGIFCTTEYMGDAVRAMHRSGR
jgi:hypothetical protein